MPKVSVVVPIYGVEKYLRQALDSLLSQTLHDIEIILLDDGSKDNCPQIIDEYAQKDKRIVVIHKKNGGYGQTCNLGIQKAKGEYIAIFEPDDYIDEKMYEDLYESAKQNDVEIVKSAFFEFFDTPELKLTREINWNKRHKLPDNVFNSKDNSWFLYFHPSIWSCIFKRDFILKNNIKFKEVPGAGWTDNPFQLQAFCLAERIFYTPKAYYYWRIQNVNPSDEIKDVSIPLDRCLEMNQWLKENLISNTGILACHYLRVLTYLDIIFNKNLKFADIDFEKIKEITKEFNKETILTSEYITKKQSKLLLDLKKNPKKYFLKCQFKKFYQNILNVRWNKKERKIVFFGKIWRFN